MKKVVISKLKVVSVFTALPDSKSGCSGGMPGRAEHIQSEKLLLVGRLVTKDERLGDSAAFHQSGDPEQLAQSASQVELIALTGDKIHVTFATVKHVQEFRNVNVV
jgi:hypothetical protein